MSLQEHLYTSHTSAEAILGHINDLISTCQTNEMIHANKLVSCLNLSNDKQFRKNTRGFLNGGYDLIARNHPNLCFYIACRQKAITSTEKKILQYQQLGKSLDLISDFIACRIILWGNESLNLEQHCYQVIEELIEFAASKGFTPCESLPLINATSEPQNEYFESFKYKEFIKDYICFPKKNGYRSLHLVLVDTKGRHLEIQVRTLAIHAEVEAGEANHRAYKECTYGAQEIPLERERISINGYKYVDGHIFDYAGVEFPITLFQRQRNL